jgi:hypothetical protein
MVAEIDPHVTHGVSRATWLAFSPRIVERLAVPRPLSLERSLEIFLKAGQKCPWEVRKGWFQWIGLRENLQESPIFHGKIYGFRLRFSLKPIH